jgi:hypothetical protein
MENGPFIDDFPIETSIYKGFSMAMLNNQMVNHHFPRGNHHFSEGKSPLVHLCAEIAELKMMLFSCSCC